MRASQKKRSRTTSVLTALVLTGSLLAACGNNGDPNSSSNNVSQENEGVTASKPVTITTVYSTDASEKTKPGETKENNFVTKWAHDSLGIDVKALWTVPSDQYENKLRLMLTAGEELPDVVNVNGPLMETLLQSGKFKEIGPDFDKYASPELKEAYKDPAVWNYVMRDGKRMAIPTFFWAQQDNPVLWIRQDLLEKTGLPAPQTFEDMEKLAEAFKKLDSNLIPLGISLKNGFTEGIGDATWVFGPYGTIPTQWLKGEDGKLVYGTLKPEMKQGLTKLNEWYDKGYISKEAALHDQGKLAELIGQGKVAMAAAPFWLPAWPLLDLRKNIEGADMKPYMLPSENGKIGAKDFNYFTGGVLVNKDFEHTDALFAYFNKLFEYNNPQPGSEFEHGFKEGYDYIKKADGTYSSDPKDFPDNLRIVPHKFFIALIQDPFLYPATADRLMSGVEPATPYEVRTMNERGKEQMEPSALIYRNGDKYVPNAYIGAPTKTMVSKGDVLRKMENEKIVEFIYGRSSAEDWDKFVQDFNSAGFEQVTQEVNEAAQTLK